MKPDQTAEHPLLGRVFEARAEAELASTSEWDADELAQTGAAAQSEDFGGRASDEPLLPFLGTVVEHVLGTTITVERRLDLQEDLYLPDHSFVFAPGVKPVSACLPVLPMTMSLEAMAEVGACLVPGYGLLGFEDVQAARWIELSDTDTAQLHISARFEDHDAERGVSRIAVAIRVEGQTAPAISARVIFGDHYLVELAPAFAELANAHRFAFDAEQLYAERHMFHGPNFQTIVGDIIVGDNGVAGELLVRSPDALFRSTRRPQLLTCPTLLDAIGQLVAVWALEHERFAFPIGLAKLEIYGPTPAVGTRTPVRVQIARPEAKAVIADIEVQDGSGGVWMRIEGWRSWKFRWARRLVDFRRLPDRFLLSETLTASESSPVISMLNSNDLGNFDPGMIARYCLSMDEMATFKSHADVPQRQQQWLLGRVAAKDAVRLWAAKRMGKTMRLHPASFIIESDANGRPVVKGLTSCDASPIVSLAHCETRAIAAAHTEAVGVDIERIAARDKSCIEMFTTLRERQMLDGFPAAERDAWITRLWCAKEALGKLFGSGLSAPNTIEAIAAGGDGRIEVRDHKSSRTFAVDTTQDGEFIIASTASGCKSVENTHAQ